MGVEIDWISRRQGQHQFWEIKSVHRLGDFLQRGFHKNQILRLRRALEVWSLRSGPTSLHLMEVGPRSEYQAVPLDFLAP